MSKVVTDVLRRHPDAPRAGPRGHLGNTLCRCSALIVPCQKTCVRIGIIDPTALGGAINGGLPSIGIARLRCKPGQAFVTLQALRELSAPVTELSALPDSRAERAYRWACECLGMADANIAPASADASFRRYFRLTTDGHSWILMDAPPEQEDCAPFLRVASLMHDAGLHVPAVLAEDLGQGFLLLDDLGTRTYLDVINDGNADALFADAIRTLVAWQCASQADVLPDYDRPLLSRELQLFPEWYMRRHLGLTLNADELAGLDEAFDRLIVAAMAQPKVYVHRDYMPRNLMVSQPNPGVLDFQDAVYGPLAYDPISLFKDAFLSWPAERVDHWLQDYHRCAASAGLPMPEWSTFRRDCDWIGLQRHLKVLGIFARIHYRDGKPKYLSDTPRFVRYVMDVLPRYKELATLLEIFERYVLPRVDAS